LKRFGYSFLVFIVILFIGVQLGLFKHQNNSLELNSNTPELSSPLPDFTQYDIASGLSYLYGFSLADYNNDGKIDISYFDSYTHLRKVFRKIPGVNGYLTSNSGKKSTIVINDNFSYLSSDVTSIFLFERHIPVDINNDGWLDIVGVANSHEGVVAYINPASENKVWQPRVITNNVPGVINIDSADIDGDGDEDLFISLRYQPGPGQLKVELKSGVRWLENTQSTDEWPIHEIDSSDFFYDTRTVKAGDINQDGLTDVLVSDSNNGNVAWFSQHPDGWERHKITEIDAKMAHYGELFDLDSDGDLDIIMPRKGGIDWVENIQQGVTWKIHKIIAFEEDDVFITEVKVGDINLDNRNDIIFSYGEFSTKKNIIGGIITVMNDPSGWKSFDVYTDKYSRMVGLNIVDFDNDGDLDIVSNLEYHANRITLWINELVH